MGVGQTPFKERIVRKVVCGAVACVLLSLAATSGAQEPAPKSKQAPTKAPPTKPAKPKSEPLIVAAVGGDGIYRSEVEYEVSRALVGQDVPAPLRRFLEAQALQQLVDRRVVLAHLQSKGEAAGQQEIEHAMQRLVADLTRQKLTLADHLDKLGLDEPALRGKFAWQITWKKYLERMFTNENLAKYFERNRREFDGTQLRVAHILFKAKANKTPADRAATLARAKQLREDIVKGTLTFADAAAKNSMAPTAKEGGDIGLISRHDPMPEEFSRAAYVLKKGEVSEPVETALGVHLITVLEEMPGDKKLSDVRSEVEVAFAQFLFERLAEQLRPSAKIEFTGKAPYFDPQTGEVVAPADATK